MEILLSILISAVVSLGGGYIGAYIREKGKNLATKEDVGKITDEVERVKTSYVLTLKQIEQNHTLLLENLKGRHQLRMAALEKRLEVHQEAFVLWRRLLTRIGPNEPMTNLQAIIQECQAFWDTNCLYLAADAREKFVNAIFCAGMHRQLSTNIRGPEDLKPMQENMARIREAGEAIVAGVELPSLGEREAESPPQVQNGAGESH